MKTINKYSWMLSNMKHLPVSLVFILLLEGCDGIISALLPRYLGSVIDMNLSEKNVNRLLFSCFICCILYFLSHLITILLNYVFSLLAKKIAYNMKKNMLHKLFSISGEDLINSNSMLLSLFMNDIALIQNFISVGIPTVLATIIFLIAISLVLFFYNYSLFFCILLTIILTFCIQLIFNKKLSLASKKLMIAYDRLVHFLKFNLSKISYSIGLDAEKYVTDLYIPLELEFLETTRLRTNLNNLSTTIPSFVTSLCSVLILGFGTYLIMNKQLSIGTFTIFIFYANKLYPALKGITNFIAGYKQVIISFERTTDIMMAKEIR